MASLAGIEMLDGVELVLSLFIDLRNYSHPQLTCRKERVWRLRLCLPTLTMLATKRGWSPFGSNYFAVAGHQYTRRFSIRKRSRGEVVVDLSGSGFRLRGRAQVNVRQLRCDAMRFDAMRCDSMRCDAIRCDAMRRLIGGDGTEECD